MRRALILTMVMGGGLLAQKLSLQEVYAPRVKPDRVILNVTADMATSMAVTFRTSTAVTEAYAEIAVAEDGPLYPKSAKKVKATTATLKSDLGDANYHSVIFEGLQPATVYAYRVGSEAFWSEWHQFRTASQQPKPLTFIYFGDAQNDILSMWSRVVRDSFRQASEAAFILDAGDLVNEGPRDAQWGEWHEAAGWINAMTPSLPTPGNHEYHSLSPIKHLTEHWRAQFTLPENGISGLLESNYYIDVQGVRMISLNSNEKLKEQAVWLDKVLSNNRSKWTIVTFHHPVYSTAKGRDNKEVRAAWQPLFDKYAVDLVLQGHDHSYGRSNLLTGENARTGKNGTVYVVSVSGPKMYNLMKEDWMVRAAEQTQLYQVIRVDGDKLLFESRTGTGKLYDAFELRKRAGQSNEIINHVPDVPARVGLIKGKAED